MVLLVIKRRYVLVIAEIEDGVNCDQLIIREVKYLGMGRKVRNLETRSLPYSSSINVTAFCWQKEMLKNAWKNTRTCMFFLFKNGWRQLV